MAHAPRRRQGVDNFVNKNAWRWRGGFGRALRMTLLLSEAADNPFESMGCTNVKGL
jgi:hypothetical protein